MHVSYLPSEIKNALVYTVKNRQTLHLLSLLQCPFLKISKINVDIFAYNYTIYMIVTDILQLI